MITSAQRLILQIAEREHQLFVPTEVKGSFSLSDIDNAERDGLLRYDGSHFGGEFLAWSITDKGRKALAEGAP